MRNIKVGIVDVYKGKSPPNQRIYEQILSYNKIDHEIFTIGSSNFLPKLKMYDFVIYRWPNNDTHHQLSSILRHVFDGLGLSYLPNHRSSWHYDDKVKEYFLISCHGEEVGAISVPSHIFFSKEEAIRFAKSAQYPIVAKLNKGAGSSNVWLINSEQSAIKHIRKSFSNNGLSPYYMDSFRKHLRTSNYNWRETIRYFVKKIVKKRLGIDMPYWQRHKNYVLFQEYLQGNTYDTRVTTVGERVHAFRRFTRKNDFRASGGIKWDLNPQEIDQRMLKIALDFSKKMNFSTMAYDFIYDENREPRIVEISYMFGQPGFPDFMNGYWDKNLQWIEGRYWPQYFELKDFLNIPDLRCPEISMPTEWIKNDII